MRTIKPKTSAAYGENTMVQVAIDNLNVRKGPGKKYASIGFIEPGTYEVTEIVETEDSERAYGKLSDGSGWISLDFAAWVENFTYVTGRMPNETPEELPGTTDETPAEWPGTTPMGDTPGTYVPGTNPAAEGEVSEQP